jgi:hypothetical protein
MTSLPIAPDYTDKDFASLNRRLDHLITAIFPDWTDTSRANFGNILKECFCFSGDVLTFYQDKQAKESKWSTADLRSSVIASSKLIDYQLDGAGAATGTVYFSLGSVSTLTDPGVIQNTGVGGTAEIEISNTFWYRIGDFAYQKAAVDDIAMPTTCTTGAAEYRKVTITVNSSGTLSSTVSDVSSNADVYPVDPPSGYCPVCVISIPPNFTPGTTPVQTSWITDVWENNTASGDVNLPEGTILKTKAISEPVQFQTTTTPNATISAGDMYTTATIEQSEDQSDSFTALGEANETFTLTQTPFLDDSETITIGGSTWTQVDNFVDSTSTSKHYTISVDEYDQGKVKTGDGTNGAIPTTGDAVLVDYKIGGGLSGNVEASSVLNLLGGPFTDSLGNPVNVYVINVAALAGGSDRETTVQAKQNAPRSIRVLSRCVARQDFEDVAEAYSGVSHAFMMTSNQSVSVAENYGNLYIVPDAGGAAGSTLLTNIENEINVNYPPMLTFGWEARATTFVTINITATVYLDSDSDNNTVETNVLAALREFFSPLASDGSKNTTVKFGYYYQMANPTPGLPAISDPEFPLSDIHNLINDTDGVRRMGTSGDGEGTELNSTEDNVTLEIWNFPQAGTLTLINGDTGATFTGHPIAI